MNGHVAGLDLSLAATGWAKVDTDGSYVHGLVRTKPEDGWLGRRLDLIVTGLVPVLVGARLVVVETPFNAQFGTDPNGVYFVAMLAIERLRLSKPVGVAPTCLKVYATSSGVADKAGMGVTAGSLLGFRGHNNNEIDALWLAHLGWHLLGAPVVELPPEHTRTLAESWAIGWPGHDAEVAAIAQRKAEKAVARKAQVEARKAAKVAAKAKPSVSAKPTRKKAA